MAHSTTFPSEQSNLRCQKVFSRNEMLSATHISKNTAIKLALAKSNTPEHTILVLCQK